MEVIVAKTAGFCFGVKRAVDKVYEQIEKGGSPIYTYGPIIHNEEVVKDLEAKGVDEIKTASFIVRWKEIISSKLDGKALKAALPEIYNQYCKESASRRFTIA